MSYRLPVEGSAAREAMGDIAHVVNVLAPANVHKLVPFCVALRNARRTIEGNDFVRRVNVICLRADDERWLISVGRRGGWKKVWNFGTGR